MNLDQTYTSSRIHKNKTQKKSYKPRKSNTNNTRKSAKAPSDSLFCRLGWLCLGEEEEVLVLQSHTRKRFWVAGHFSLSHTLFKFQILFSLSSKILNKIEIQ